MHLLITRPIEDADATMRALKQQGHNAVSVPLLTIAPVANLSFDLQDVQGLVITSANGIRAFAQANEQRDMAIYAVGQASAHTASALGFTHVDAAQGDVPSLARLIEQRCDKAAGALLHLSGAQRAGDIKALLEVAGFTVRRQNAYGARALDHMPQTLAGLLTPTDRPQLDGVLFFSPRTAHIFKELVTDSGFNDACGHLTAYCLSQAVADALTPLRFKGLRTAPRRDQEALLALLDSE